MNYLIGLDQYFQSTHLDNLFDKGLITLDEYHERRKKIIETA